MIPSYKPARLPEVKIEVAQLAFPVLDRLEHSVQYIDMYRFVDGLDSLITVFLVHPLKPKKINYNRFNNYSQFSYQ